MPTRSGADAKAGLGAVGGVAIGLILTLLYVKLGFTLPAWLQPADEIARAVTTFTAAVSSDDADLGQLRREIAVRMGDPGYYAEIDQALGGFITEEILWRESTKRALMLLQQQLKTMEEHAAALPGELGESLSRVLARLPGQTAERNALVRAHLARRFPGMSDSEIADEMVRMSTVDLLQVRVPAGRMVAALSLPGEMNVVVLDSAGAPIKRLMDAHLPAGQYRLYWDFTDDDGNSVDDGAPYSYEIRFGGALVRAERLDVVETVWR